MAQPVKPSVRIARTFINLIPNSKILHGLANMYIEKFNNFRNINMHTNGEQRWLTQAIGALETPTIVDVGANVGNWTQNVLDINSSVNVHAFEPDPATFLLLAKRQFPERVRINNAGLGDEKKSITFYQYGDAHSHNSLYPRHDKPYQSEIEITIDTLENYCHQQGINHIHYLKIDTEGHDYFVMKGAKSFFEQERVDIVQFEYGNNYIDARVFLKDIFDFIAPYNYSLYRIMPNRLLHIPVYHNVHEKFIYSNYTIINNQIASKLGIGHR